MQTYSFILFSSCSSSLSLRDARKLKWICPYISLYWISFHWELWIPCTLFLSPRQHLPKTWNHKGVGPAAFLLCPRKGDESGVRERIDTLFNHLQFASQTWGQSLHQTMVIDYFFLKRYFLKIWDEFKTGMKISTNTCFLWLGIKCEKKY